MGIRTVLSALGVLVFLACARTEPEQPWGIVHDPSLVGQGNDALPLGVNFEIAQLRVTGACPSDTFATAVGKDGSLVCARPPPIESAPLVHDSSLNGTADPTAPLGVNFDVAQARITGTCVPSTFAMGVGKDGSVTCAAPDFPAPAPLVRDNSLVGDGGATAPLGINFQVAQARITGTCPAGTYATGVGQDGSLNCSNAGESVSASGTGVYTSGPVVLPEWTWSSDQPVLTPGPSNWDASGVASLGVVKVGGTYRMWYSGADFSSTWRIGTATSTDGVSWTKDPSNPVLQGSAGWDAALVGGPQVVYDGTTYWMYFHGYDGAHWRMGLATSTDGVHFKESPQNPVLNLGGGWDSASAFEASVLLENGTFTMWYTGYNGSQFQIGRATSPDGVTWTKDPANPLIGAGAAGEPNSAQTPTVIKVRHTYYMIYDALSGGTWQMAFATSMDGRTWTRQPQFPVVPLIPGTFHSSGSYGPAAMVIDGDLIRLWTPAFNGSRWTIGLLLQDAAF